MTADQLRTMSIAQIAELIFQDWRKIGETHHNVHPTALPYLDAMLDLQSVDDHYIHDSGRSIVRYFLNNASSYRGETAKLIKAELRARVGDK